jgi:hypothetical protein
MMPTLIGPPDSNCSTVAMVTGTRLGEVLIVEAETKQLCERRTLVGWAKLAGEASFHEASLPAIVLPCSVIRVPTQPRTGLGRGYLIGERAPDLACFSAAVFPPALSVIGVLAGSAPIFDGGTLLRAACLAA